MSNLKKPELLAPAGDLEKLKIAVLYGADAVYIGGEAYSLRAKAKNFNAETMKEGIDFAHAHGAKVYVTANIFAHNSDFDGMGEYFKSIYEMGADAVLVSDPGVYTVLKEYAPDLELHVSTQANNTNYKTAQFWYKLGAKRIVGARELSLKEIKEMRQHSRRYGNRNLCAWCNVYFLFRTLPALQLFYRKRCKSGSMYPSMQMEVFHRGRDQTK